jgi:hypothetical protein
MYDAKIVSPVVRCQIVIAWHAVGVEGFQRHIGLLERNGLHHWNVIVGKTTAKAAEKRGNQHQEQNHSPECGVNRV